ncbi:MAG: preprotein translocase subunit SecG [Ruminiclostridium sp.]|nr:preprotein translocase subunit SecG [Ruminiclostridium sp.]
MSVIEIVFAILLIVACIFIVAVVLMQESKQGMSNVITGGSTDNYYQKNSGRTREAKLARATKIAAVLVFIIAIAVNLISVYWSGNGSADTATPVDTDAVADQLAIATTTGELTLADAATEAPADDSSAAAADTTEAAQ